MSLWKVDAIQESTTGSGVTITGLNATNPTITLPTGGDADLTTSTVAWIFASGVSKTIGLARFAGFLARLFGVYIVTDPKYGAKGDGVTDDTAAWQACVTAAIAGGGVVLAPTPSVSYYIPGTVNIVAPSGLIIEAQGQRRAKISTGSGATTAQTFVIGSDDGNHSGGTQGYNGTSGFVRFRRLWLEGPNGANTGVATSSVGITDWECGSAILEDCFIQKYGSGYAGLGADIQQWHSNLFSFNTTGAALYSRCDQVELSGQYFTQNATGLLIESAWSTKVFGGEFVGNTVADITLQQPATSSLPTTSVTQTAAPDIRLDGGFRAYGTWFESLAGTTTPRHVWIGKSGASGRVLRDVQLIGCKFVCAQTTNCVEVDAATDVKIRDCDVIDGAVVSGAFIQINAVTSVNQYVYDLDNRVPTTITRIAGTTTYAQSEQRQTGGNLTNQIKSANPALTFATFVNVGHRLLSDGQAKLFSQRNTGTEAAPTWTTASTWDYKVFEAGANVLSWGASISVQANAGALHTLNASSNIAATIAVPSNAPASGLTGRLTFQIKNTSGGAITTPIAFATGAGGYKTTGAFTNPGNGAVRSITFDYDPASGFWWETARASADMT